MSKRIGVVYKWNLHNKLNGSLFYAYEYAVYLKTNLYLVGINKKDLDLVKTIFDQKYSSSPSNITAIKLIDLYSLDLQKTLLVDIKSFYAVKEFLSGDSHVFSNEAHTMFRYKNNRKVTYYGSYDYQNYDVFNYLKLNFSIFKDIIKTGDKTFVSGVYPFLGHEKYLNIDNVIMKKHYIGRGDLFELISSVVYIHSSLDTNNRIIPEAFYYSKSIKIIEQAADIIDSITFRYNDIKNNGLSNYTLSNDDMMIQGMLNNE
jgi:hypothetical protein